MKTAGIRLAQHGRPWGRVLHGHVTFPSHFPVTLGGIKLAIAQSDESV